MYESFLLLNISDSLKNNIFYFQSTYLRKISIFDYDNNNKKIQSVLNNILIRKKNLLDEFITNLEIIKKIKLIDESDFSRTNEIILQKKDHETSSIENFKLHKIKERFNIEYESDEVNKMIENKIADLKKHKILSKMNISM